MKDYSKNAEQAKSFILGYSYVGDKIIVYYANGEMVVVENTKSVEKHLLEQMREQVLSSVDAIVVEKKRFKSNLIKSIGMGVAILGLTGICSFLAMADYLLYPTIFAIIVTFLTHKLAKKIEFDVCGSKSKINDFKKNILLLKNQAILNEQVKKDRYKVMNANAKVLDMVEIVPEDREVFNLNSIDILSLGELKRLLEAIKEPEEFGVDESKPKTLGKRKGK